VQDREAIYKHDFIGDNQGSVGCSWLENKGGDWVVVFNFDYDIALQN
jgi:hypothetical protein